MATEEHEAKKKPSPVAPLICSLLLLLCVGACLYDLWRQHTTLQAQQLAASQARTAELRAEVDLLNALLEQKPCEAKARLATLPLPPAAEDPVPALPRETPAPTPERPRETPAAAPKASPVAAEHACVFIVSADTQQNLSTGTGFFVAPGVLVTNSHVVNKAAGKILVTSKALKRPVIATLVAQATDGGRDYAILQVTLPDGAEISELPFAEHTQRTDKIGAWGFPDIVGKNDPAYRRLLRDADLSAVPELSYTEGVVSALLERKPPLIVHTAPISPGNSGGPLLNAAGEIVGINTMITLDEESYRQASIALSGRDLHDFLQQHGIPVRLGK